MSHRAYAGVWLKDFSEATLLERWEAFLGTVPFSAEHPGFSNLTIRAVDESETPIIEQDLRSIDADANVLVELAREHVHADCSYETEALWDLQIYDMATLRWEKRAQPLQIVLFGEDFDGGVWQENGHIRVDLGFEHFFTGHAGLLGLSPRPKEISNHPEERTFVALMSQPQNLNAYRENTRANILKLFDWMQRAQETLPVERYHLWSEGEENFEARVEEILASR
jgi:hypothetical protein